MKATKRRTKAGVIVTVLLIVLLLICTVRLVAPKMIEQIQLSYGYKAAQMLEDRGDYQEAIRIYQSLNGYEDSAERILTNTYALGQLYMDTHRYEEALDIFLSLGDYGDAQQQWVQCNITLGQQAYDAAAYERAITYFLDSGVKTETITEYLDKSYYNWGHHLFLQEQYQQAQACFDKMEAEQEQYGGRHFETLEQAYPYVIEQALCAEPIFFYAGDLAVSHVGYNGKLIGYAQSGDGEVTFSVREKSVAVEPDYYPGVRIVAAWKKGDFSFLSDREQQTYALAVQIVEQAKAETNSELELELWLNDWLCRNVIYDANDENYATIQDMPENWTAVGALLNGKALCQGYADAFYLLGSLADFEVLYQFGMSDGGNGWVGHVWNLILLDDKWYYLDVTWNDTADDAYVSREYVNFVEDKVHIFGTFPEVASTTDQPDAAYDYYAVNDLVYDTLDGACQQIVWDYLYAGAKISEIKVMQPGITAESLSDKIYDRMVWLNVGGSWRVSCTERADYSLFTVYWK